MLSFKVIGKLEMNEKTKKVIDFIASLLVDVTGNEIFEKLKAKRKISKILKEDQKNINRIFYTVNKSDLHNLIEQLKIRFSLSAFYRKLMQM